MDFKELSNRYIDIKKIKSGGQKEVFLAKKKNGDSVALKIISNSNIERVEREIEILKSIKIKGISCILESGFVDMSDGAQSIYIEEEYISGKSLRDYLNEGNKLDINEIVKLLDLLLTVEVELENKKIIHRDINPNNIMIDNEGNYILIDFGLAKQEGLVSLTKTTQAHGPGTVGYVPFELYHNIKELQDSRTDLFEIGVTVYESYTGLNPFYEPALPFQHQIQSNTLNKIQDHLTIDGDDGSLSNFIDLLMGKYPSQRPDSAKKAYEYFNIVKKKLEYQ